MDKLSDKEDKNKMKKSKKSKHKIRSRSPRRNRSRSYSTSNRKKHKKNKNRRKNDKVKKYNDRSSSSSLSRPREDFDKKLERMRETTLCRNKKERGESPLRKDMKIKLPNKGILANIIQDNLRANKKLDVEEVDRATENLKRVDTKSDRKVKNSNIF